MPQAPGPLGWIPPNQRTLEQARADLAAKAAMPRFFIPGFRMPTGPVRAVLTDWWKHPDVVADVGYEFTGFHQLTGSCVGASAGNAIATLAYVQRTLAMNPTRAFVPWWPFFYGRTRYNEGDRGPGEGAIDSVMAATLKREGVFACDQDGLPTFKRDDGLYLTEQIEMQYSDGAATVNTKWSSLAGQHLLGTAAPLNSIEDIKAAVINGYPVLNGCELFVGGGKIQGTGDKARVIGKYDGRGGHSTCFLGYEDHPDFGPLYLYSNQWPTDTYPKDPGGAGRCCCWMKEDDAKQLFRLGGSDGETVALSHLNWFPAQPAITDFCNL